MPRKSENKGENRGYDHIPAQMVTQISGEFMTAYRVSQELKKTQEDVQSLKVFRLYGVMILAVVTAILLPFIKEGLVVYYNHVMNLHTVVSTNPPATPKQ